LTKPAASCDPRDDLRAPKTTSPKLSTADLLAQRQHDPRSSRGRCMIRPLGAGAVLSLTGGPAPTPSLRLMAQDLEPARRSRASMTVGQTSIS
jgi:hypothetical protein